MVARIRRFGVRICYCDGPEGIPMWRLPPTIANLTRNTAVGWLDPNVPCLSLYDLDDGTSNVTHAGIIAYVVTACLTFVT